MNLKFFFSSWWLGKYFQCLARSNCLSGSSWTAHLRNKISHGFTDIVFTTQANNFINKAVVVFRVNFNLKEWAKISSVPNNVKFTIFANITSFLIRLLANFSFDSENGSRTIISFRSSDSHSRIIKSSLGKPAD